MRVVAALFLVEPARRLARPVMVLVAAILAAEALDRRPRLDPRAIDRGARSIAAVSPRAGEQRGQRFSRNLALERPIPFFGEGRMAPQYVAYSEADEPAEQKLEVQPLHQLPFRADAVKHLQQHRPQQLLRRIEGARTRCRAPQSRSKGPLAPRWQAALSSAADGRANPRLNILIAEKAICPFVAAPHRSTLNASAAKGIMTSG